MERVQLSHEVSGSNEAVVIEEHIRPSCPTSVHPGRVSGGLPAWRARGVVEERRGRGEPLRSACGYRLQRLDGR